MKLSQIVTAPNQLTLLRMVFVPFIVIHLVDGHYLWALVVFVSPGSAMALMACSPEDFTSKPCSDSISIRSPTNFC